MHPKKALECEIKVIKNLHGPYFPRFYGDGETNELIYLVVNILGPSIGDIESSNHEEITTEFIYNFAIQSLLVIKKFHECGYIHRDIKPNNFLLKKDQKNPLNLIDFGISKQYINFENGEILDPVPSRYKGTRKYASVNSHNCQDLGRCDDLFSWFYLLIEMKIGKLPWEDVKILDDVKKMKINQVPNIIKPYPEFVKIYEYLIQLKFKDKPDYDYLRSIILDEMKKNGFNDEAFNWIDFYNKMKKIQKSHLKSLNNPKIDNNKNDCINNNNINCVVNQIQTNQIPTNQQNEINSNNQNQEDNHHKHNKKSKKMKNRKKIVIINQR